MNAAIVGHLFRPFYPGEYGAARQRLGAPCYFFERRCPPPHHQLQESVADRTFERLDIVAFGESFDRRKLSLDIACGAQG
jgi:hypothetical protein